MIEDLSTEDLQAEIERRQKIKQEIPKPKQIESPDIKPLQTACQDYIDERLEKGYTGEESAQYVFETAMETFFSKDVWRFINFRS